MEIKKGRAFGALPFLIENYGGKQCVRRLYRSRQV